MLEWWEQIIEPHWSFLAAAIVFMMIGQVMKGSVFTRPRAYAVYIDELPRHRSYLPGEPRVLRKHRKVWWFAYRTLPLHPVLAGTALGFVITDPAPDISGMLSPLYFAGAGALSVFLYQVIKGLAKHQNIDLPPLPGQSVPVNIPPPPPLGPELQKLIEDEERPTNPVEKDS